MKKVKMKMKKVKMKMKKVKRKKMKKSKEFWWREVIRELRKKMKKWR
jgi:hypothetical protein